MFNKIQIKCSELVQNFDSISAERKTILLQLSGYIQSKIEANLSIQLIYVCTHNSRRSHFGQIWSAVAADYFSIPNVLTFSGGTESTAFHPNAIKALQTSGFEITSTDTNLPNPRYLVKFGQARQTICFSKVYDDSENPSNAFAAIMTCSDAEENCPFIPGVEFRIATTYDDPKVFDGTLIESEKYLERSNQIALETLFVFSNLNK
jgi:protein-tyrosine phosphatase/arsenate reductase